MSLTEPIGVCATPNCNGLLYRKTISGVPPKYCTECRRQRYKGHQDRVSPVEQTRALIRHVQETYANGDLEDGSASNITVQCAAAALSSVTGLSQVIAESVISTIDTLLEQGESEVQIRKRLNPNPAGFAVRVSGTNTASALTEYLIESRGFE